MLTTSAVRKLLTTLAPSLLYSSYSQCYATTKGSDRIAVHLCLCRALGSAAAAGELTRRRAAIVNNRHLAEAAAAAGLQTYLKASSKPLLTGIKRFAAATGSAATAADGGGGAGMSSGAGEGQEQGMGAGVGGDRGGTGARGGEGTGILTRLKALKWEIADDAMWRGVWGCSAAGGKSASDAGALAVGRSGQGMAFDVDMEDEGGGQQQQQQQEEVGEVVAAGTAAAAEVQRPYPKALADVVESIIGAVFVDKAGQGEGTQPWHAVWKIAKGLVGLP